MKSLGWGRRLDRALGRELKLEMGGMGMLYFTWRLNLGLYPGLELGLRLGLELRSKLNLKLQMRRGGQLRLPIRLGLRCLERYLRL